MAIFEHLPEETKKSNKWLYGTLALASCLLVFGSLYAMMRVGFSSPFKNVPLTSPEPAKSKAIIEISEKNREPLKAALNAIGEINSVASVGANYPQYVSALQSSKIKFDAAIRGFNAESVGDEQSYEQLVNTFICYVDAKEAWGEFLENGDSYGFVKATKSRQLSKMAQKYNFIVTDGEYYKDSVMKSILTRADADFNKAESIINSR